MAKTIDLSAVSNFDLYKELLSRGFKTDLIMGLQDVEWVLDDINDNREEDKIQLEESDMRDVLDYVFSNTDGTMRALNQSIEEYILDNFDDEDYYLNN